MKLRVIILLSIVFVINIIGLIALSSASLAAINSSFLLKQLTAQGIALLMCYFCAKMPLKLVYRCKNFLFCISIIALIIVLIPSIGKTVNGSRRWIPIAGFNLQVSEFAKIAMIIWLAGYIHDYYESLRCFVDGFFVPISVCCFFALFIILEPDYGTTFLVLVTAAGMLYLSGINWKYLIFSGVLGGVFFVFLLYLSPVRFRRLTSFFFVEDNRFDATYQLWQSLICFASGGLYGTGIGLSRQKLSYLPEAHTDFIFSIIGEEFGVLFALLLLILFVIFMIIALNGVFLKKDPFIRALGYGATMIITLQALINTAMVSGCCPTKGMALPFISYGGSNLIAMYILFGLIINCINSTDINDVYYGRKLMY